MKQLLKKRLKEQRGFTLIELLAVIVILGILAAIAVPSVLGIIDNSKKDAHVANAQQMVSSAKMAVANNADLQSGTKYLTLEYLESAKYLDPVKDPDGGNYTISGTTPGINTLAGVEVIDSAPSGSYVTVSNGVVTQVKLVNGTRGVQGTGGAAVDATNITRSNVTP